MPRAIIDVGFRCSLFVIIMVFVPSSVSSMAMVRVASWNLLAQDYVKEYKYPWTRETPGCLDWDHRKSLIVDKLLDKRTKMDIVCLQEVQMDLFSDLLSSISPDFDGVIQNVTGGHNVGTAVLIRNSCKLRIKRVESRSRALIATLEDKDNENNIYICSVHLNADKSLDPKEREHHQKQRRSQLKSLLKRINYACKLEQQIIKEVPILLAGDFNMLRENPLHESLVEGSLTTSPSAHVSLHDAYFEAERHKRQSVPVYHPSLSEEEDSAGKTTKNDQHLVKTYKGGAILDYIYTSDEVKVADTLLYHPSSSHVGTEKWPCHDHPSDHLPIGIDIEWN
eukprot:CAMPEP_0168274190 /NCGR_PEP_ID=MMETSP0141_2-20121125/17150_1 /TAXON_ID=44445 /ORGANISM="Pseudo-nitzschia australis, Strain 10249 10 AB" /LENGTH=336 /DNA_ID=CAMNT_0008215729 /DNA_START=196 /DNA_END=1206 /DNA_ORIENTATION=-